MFPAASRLSEPRAGEAIRSRAPFAYRQDAFEYAVPPSARALHQEGARGCPHPPHTAGHPAAQSRGRWQLLPQLCRPCSSAGRPGPARPHRRCHSCTNLCPHDQIHRELLGVDDHWQECTRSRTMFGECRPMLNSWAGGLELLACAPAHRICIVMLAERPDLLPCCFNPKPGLPRGPRIALWYTKDHYDLLQPPACQRAACCCVWRGPLCGASRVLGPISRCFGSFGCLFGAHFCAKQGSTAACSFCFEACSGPFCCL